MSRYLQPLFVGRLTRVILGLACFFAIPFVPVEDFAWIGIVALLFGGLSFVIGGLVANPGCELTALPNLVLPRRHRLHFL